MALHDPSGVVAGIDIGGQEGLSSRRDAWPRGAL